MAFVKLDTGILHSTLWVERECREIFITALLMAEPRELREPVEQIAVESLEHTGFVVPAGWYGFVEAAGPGIVRMALVDHDSGMAALARLGQPDPASRSSDFDGRRLVRVDGGFVVLNFIKYREKDASAADRQKRWRERQKLKQHNAVTVTPSRVISNQAEAEAEAEAEVTVVPSIKKKTSAKREFRIPDWIPREPWQAWIEVRAQLKAPNTARALELAVRTLDDLRNNGHTPTAILELATQRGWRGLFAPQAPREQPGAPPYNPDTAGTIVCESCGQRRRSSTGRQCTPCWRAGRPPMKKPPNAA